MRNLEMGDLLLEVTNLKKYFPIRGGVFNRKVGYVRAVDGVSFYLKRGESFGIVGESGCGKSTAARAILRLIEPTEGSVLFEGGDVLSLTKKGLRSLRRDMQMIFQDPYASLDPRRRIGQIIAEPLNVFNIYSNKAEKQDRISYLLNKVGLQVGDSRRYPHEFSGGQRQRIGIARALAMNPKLIIGDEPVSALDVSIQAQIINLLEDIQEEFGLSYIIIAHDLAVVEHICDRIAVMYLGKIVESAPDVELYTNPRHPYTQALLSAVPIADPDHKRERIHLTGDVPSPVTSLPGCNFYTRCPARMEICAARIPELIDIGGEHCVACHRTSSPT